MDLRGYLYLAVNDDSFSSKSSDEEVDVDDETAGDIPSVPDETKPGMLH